MRKIDTEAYNKRLHTEIMELDKMIKSINPENINQFDAGLIKTADTYIKLISDTTWADNSNFNGIEIHKVKNLIMRIKKKNRKYLAKYIIIPNFYPYIKSGDTTFIDIKESITVDLGFDGRKSFVVPKVIWYSASTVSDNFNTLLTNPFSTGQQNLVDDDVDTKTIIRKKLSEINIEVKTRAVLVRDDDTKDRYQQKGCCLAVFYILWK